MEAGRREVERWFLREGTPWVLRDRRAHPVTARMLPASVAAAAYTPVYTLAAVLLLIGVDPVRDPVGAGLRAITALLLGLVAAVVAVVVFLRLRRTREALRTRTAGVLGIVAALVLNVGSDLLSAGPGAALSSLWQTAGPLAVAALVVASGLGALVGWAIRRLVVRAIPLLSVVSRAIPPLLLLVAFLFINAEAWQMSANLSRGRLWAVAGFLVAVLVLFLVFRLPREIAELQVTVDAEHVRRACAGTPLQPWAARLTAVPERHPLRGPERANLVALLFVAQGIQVLALGFAVFVLFLAFGSLAITDVTVEQWIGRPPTPGVLWGLPVSVSNELANVCIVIGALAALYFGIYSLTDQEYRTEFLDDLLAEIRTGLLARECYLVTTDPSGDEHEPVP